MQEAFADRSDLREERPHQPLALRPALLLPAALVEGGWLAAFVERARLPVPTSVLALIGTGLLILDAFAFASTVRTRRGGIEPGPAFLPAADDGTGEDEDRDLDEGPATARGMRPARRAGAAVARVRRSTPDAPAVTLVRVGGSGVELLLDEEAGAPLPGFAPLETWRTWRLVEDDLEDDAPFEVELEVEELGSDEDGTYFAPRQEAGERTTRLVVVADGNEVVVEPYGLRLRPPERLERVPEPTEPGTASRSSAEPSPTTTVTALDAEAGDVLEDAWPADDLFAEHPLERASDVRAPALPIAATARTTPAAEPFEPERDDWLIPPGAVEVRLLREVPDLVGALVAPASPAAVEFVAYLASHGHRATTPRLRDSLGTARTRLSRSGKTVWSAAGAARQCLGEERLPRASGNDAYVLADDVSCDWVRFGALLELAERTADEAVVRRGLAQALSLVKGVPAASSRRFGWVEEEHLLEAVTTAVTTAAERLARLELAALERGEGDGALVQRAIATGRLLDPRATPWRELERRLEASS
ncbi:MAG: hypothetical protein M0Z46_20995 [Actinomycetota bacterium]|nr:hypothetical protein [Actinomycetota bacterium]